LKKFKKRDEIPKWFVCNIGYEPFFNPYVTGSGFSYEKKLILKHFQKKEKAKDPLTNE